MKKFMKLHSNAIWNTFLSVTGVIFLFVGEYGFALNQFAVLAIRIYVMPGVIARMKSPQGLQNRREAYERRALRAARRIA